MRGAKLGFIRGAVFLGTLLGASASFAQQDPRVWFYFDNVATCAAGYAPQIGFDLGTGTPVQTATCVPTTGTLPAPAPTFLTTVSQSRTVGTTTFKSRAAYDLGIWNNNTNDLNRLYFRVRLSNPNGKTDVNGTVENGTVEKLVNATGFSCYKTDDPNKATLAEPYGVSDLTCTSNNFLLAKDGNGTIASTALTIVVITPFSGDPLNVDAFAGGYEGNSQTGQGCCAMPHPTVRTTLIDSVASGDYEFTTKTAVYSNDVGKVFTGNGQATRADLFATDVTAPAGWGNEKFDIASIAEKSFPEGGGRCKQSKLKYCQETRISLPAVAYAQPSSNANVCTSDPLLDITLTLDSSLVKGNLSNLDLWTALRVKYDDNDDGVYEQVLGNCGNTSPATFPCICNINKINGGKTIEFKIKNFKNGGYFVE